MVDLRVYMLVFIFSLTWLSSVSGSSSNNLILPDSFGATPVLTRVDEIKTWAPDDMYEHVNGEAELLIRYGALNLTYAAYEGEGAAYLSSEILDLGESINAYGLYRLYAGCDGEEYSFSNITVLFDDFTSHAILGKYFIRINVDISGSREKVRIIVDEFLSELSKALPPPEPLPDILDYLKQMARRPCEVNYHPEHMDYDLESGPGYFWIRPDGETYFMSLFPSQDEAEVYAATLRSNDIPAVYRFNTGVIWQKESNGDSRIYSEEVLEKVLEM